MSVTRTLAQLLVPVPPSTPPKWYQPGGSWDLALGDALGGIGGGLSGGTIGTTYGVLGAMAGLIVLTVVTGPVGIGVVGGVILTGGTLGGGWGIVHGGIEGWGNTGGFSGGAGIVASDPNSYSVPFQIGFGTGLFGGGGSRGGGGPRGGGGGGGGGNGGNGGNGGPTILKFPQEKPLNIPDSWWANYPEGPLPPPLRPRILPVD